MIKIISNKFKILSIVLAATFAISTFAYAETDVDNVAPNAGLSATVIHPQKLDLILMTDYTGSKKSNLLSDINASLINKLYSKNVDVKLYTEDTSNVLNSGTAYYKQEYSGAPISTNAGLTPSSGIEEVSSIVDSANSYKRQISSGYGKLYWNTNNTLTYQWKDGASESAMYEMGEAPIATTTNNGFVTLTDAPTNIAEIGASRHALYVLTTDGNLYYSGSPSTIASNWWAIYMGSYPAQYTGFKFAFSGVKDIKTNINGIAVLKADGTVYYGGNVGLQTIESSSNGSSYYPPSNSAVMNVSTKTNAESEYTINTNNYVVTDGFQQIPGMIGITRIQLGNESIIGLNDTTGDCYGIGYNQGQFGFGDPYYRQCTVDTWSKQYTIPVELATKKIPLLDARKIKDLYMYGFYTKVIQKDRTIWRLEGGGFTTQATESGVYTGCMFATTSCNPGTYTQVGKLADDELTSIDTTAKYTCTTTKTYNMVYSSSLGYNVNAFYTKYKYTINVTGVTSIKNNGTQSISTTTSTNVITTTNTGFEGLHQVYSLNTDNVVSQSYRDGADKIILYVSDNTSTDFINSEFGSYYPMTGLSNSFMTFLGTNNAGTYIVTPSSMLDFIEKEWTSQQVSLRQISNATQDGHLYNTGNYAQALTDIYAKYANSDQPLNKYVIANEDIVQYNTQFIDRENDTQKTARWMYNHNPDIFQNNTGVISTNNKWVDAPITMFSKVGEYKTTYQVQDDPTMDDEFSNYDYWSNQTNQLDIIAHRRPLAKFTVKVPRKVVTSNNMLENFDDKHELATVYNNCNMQNNGYGGSKALNGASIAEGNEGTATVTINVPSNSTNATLSYAATGSSFKVTLDGVEAPTSTNMNSIMPLTLTPGTHVLSASTIFVPATSSYNPKTGKDIYTSEVYGKFTLDNIQVSYDTSNWVDGSASDYVDGQAAVNYIDTSYDLDHTQLDNINTTLSDTLPDKGIQSEEWKWIDTTPGVNGTWQTGKLNKVTKDHYYQVSLRVQDLEGAWSIPYTLELGDDVSIPNNPPAAKFTLYTNRMAIGSENTITDLSSDPDNDPIVERDWVLLDGNGITIQDYGTTMPHLNTLATGNYQLKLKVRDDPSARGASPSMWSDEYIQDFIVLPNINLTAKIGTSISNLDVRTTAQQGQRILLSINTTGYVKYLTISFPDEITNLDNTLPINKTITEEENHTEQIYYTLPLKVPLTIDKDNNRLLPNYKILVTGTKADGTTASAYVYLDVNGSILDGFRTCTINDNPK